jgi:RluA family pseudouridine synthase
VKPPVIKLSAPAVGEFWEIPVLFEDEHLLALDKPARLLTSPDRLDPERPDLMKLLHAGIAEGKSWAKERGLTYLANAHRLDFETSGVLLLAKNKPALVALANLFGSEKPLKTYVAITHGMAEQPEFDVDAPLGPHPRVPGLMAVNPQSGKKAKTHFEVLTQFRGYTLLQCRPLTSRAHQIRVHLRWVKMPVIGDEQYHGAPLYLSTIKRAYRLGPGKVERPLIATAALHAAELTLPHPVTGQDITINAEWPKALRVAVKYLKEFAGL